MAVDTSPKPNGLKVALDTIVAPKAAFESIRIAPTWGWALLLVLVSDVGNVISHNPGLIHAYPGTFAQQVATNPQLSSGSPEQQQMALAIGQKVVSFVWL